MAKKILSIEIGQSLAKIVEIKYSNRPVVTKHIDIELPQGIIADGGIIRGDVLADCISDAIEVAKFSTKRVIFVINSSKIAGREVLIPKINEKKIKTLIEKNATDYFPIDLEDYEIGYVLLDNGAGAEQKRPVMVYLAPKAILKDYYELADKCGLDIENFDFGGNSLYQAIKIEGQSTETSMFIKIDETNSTVSVVSDDRLMLQRSISYGVDGIIKDVMAEKGLSYMQALDFVESHPAFETDDAKEDAKLLINGIQRTIDFYMAKNRAKPIANIYLTGIGGAAKGLGDIILEATGITAVQLIVPGNMVGDKRIKGGQANRYIGNIGGTIAPIGFVQDEKDGSGLNGGNNGNLPVLINVMCVLGSIILAAAGVVPYLFARNERDARLLYLNTLKYVIEEYNTYVDTKAKNEYLNELNDKTFNRNEEIVGFIEEMEEKMPADITVSSFICDEYSVTMSVEVEDMKEAAFVINTLQTFESLSDVSVTSVNETSDDAGETRVGFSVQCTYKTVAESTETESDTSETVTESADETLEGGIQ
ncbi:MAG: pilus assembly protein PilM [Acetatifactor sp.]|nr:pilus assembly protein PilM [Acetatifactor sp.]